MPTPATMVKLMKALGMKAPQDDALEIARINAVKMLGLPENNTPMDRARALGMEEMYHGTMSDIRQIDPAMFGKTTNAQSAKMGFFGAGGPTGGPETANSYALGFKNQDYVAQREKAEKKFWRDIAPVKKEKDALSKLEMKGSLSAEQSARLRDLDNEFWTRKQEYWKNVVDPLRELEDFGGANVMPMMVRSKDFMVRDFPQGYRDQTYADVIKQAKDAGYPGVKLTNTVDYVGSVQNPPKTTIFAALEPSTVRSRFAAFDPARANENNLLASRLLPFALPGLLAIPQDE